MVKVTLGGVVRDMGLVAAAGVDDLAMVLTGFLFQRQVKLIGCDNESNPLGIDQQAGGARGSEIFHRRVLLIGAKQV